MVSDDTAKYELDLRKGVLVLAVLSQLRTPQYGYSLRQALGERGMPIEEGTLYPLLRRLEAQGLLDSSWQAESGPPRRYYVLSARGLAVFGALGAAWGALTDTMTDLLEGNPS